MSSACRKPSSRMGSFPAMISPPPATARIASASAPTTASQYWCATASARRGRRHGAAGIRRRAEARAGGDHRRHAHHRLLRAERPDGGLRQVSLQARLVPRGHGVPRRRTRAASGARGGGRFQHRAGGSRRPRSRSLARTGALLGARAGGVPRLARAGIEGQLPPVRSAGEDVQLVGLPAARVPEEPRAAHRPHPAVAGARRRGAPHAGSIATRARANAPPTTRR